MRLLLIASCILYAAIFSASHSQAQDATPTPETPSDLNRVCSKLSAWNNSFIYKTIGSKHFGDVRRNTIGLVIRSGYRGPFPGKLKVYDTLGKTVGALALYATGGGWAGRYYAGIKGTPARNGAAIARIAKKNTGSENVYIAFNKLCYGPIKANRCIGSKQC